MVVEASAPADVRTRPGSDELLVLRPGGTRPGVLLRSVAAALPLTLMLARRDFFVRYRRTAFGLLWAVALPLVQAAVLAVVLNRVANIHVPHFALFIVSGMIGWTYFLATLTAGATSIVDNSAMSSRIYFPRAVLPLSVCLANVYGLVVGIVIVIVIGAVEGVPPGLHTLWFVPAAALLFVTSVGFTLTISALHVYFRDLRFAVQAALFVWFYVTPVFYPISYVHGPLRTVAIVNPICGAIEMFHAAVVGSEGGLTASVLAALGWAAGLLVVGLGLHCRFDRRFADLL